MRRLFALLICLGFLSVPARGAQSGCYVALTFDDGPSGRYTRQLLDGLARRDARATFLLCGYRMAEYPELTRRIFQEGHEIGYHGYSHKSMRDMSRRSIAGEITDSRELLPEDCDPKFFRPPGGYVTDGVRQVAEARQLAVLSWSVDPKDWATDNVGAIETAVLKHVKDGDIVLLHDMTSSSVQAALDIIDVLSRQGFEFVTVSELARIRNVRIRPGAVYTAFPPESETDAK